MPNPFLLFAPDSMSRPATDAFLLTPSNTVDLPRAARGLYVGGAGDVALTTLDGSNATFAGLAAGTFMPVGAVRILLTGTTATNIVGLV